jgi:hypothetical protein
MEEEIDTMPEDTVLTMLTQLGELDNLKRLKLLRREIQFIVKHRIQPTIEWYEERAHYIYEYETIDWIHLEIRFNQKDSKMHYTAANIIELLELLTQELATSATFTLQAYYKLIEEIHHIWTHYHTTYMGNEDDMSVVELIEDLTHLMGSKLA